MAINEERSYTEYNVEVPTTDFPIGFDILDDGVDVVAVTLNDVDPTTLGYTVIQVNSTTYRFAPAVPSGVVRLTRITDIDQMAHVFTEGAIFISENMDGNFKQIRHAQQEVRDGFNKLSTDTNKIIDTLQVVGEAAQDAAAAAEAAAELANDAAAAVNDKVSYSDLDNAVDIAVSPIKDYVALPYEPLKSYRLYEGVQLENGDIVKSTVANNTNDPNISLNGWVLLNTSINFKTIADMLATITPKNGSTCYVAGYYTPSNYATVTPYQGGGIFRFDITKVGINDGGVVLNGWVRVDVTHITPQMFGARGNGVDDDSAAFEKCVKYIVSLAYTPKVGSNSIVGMKLSIPSTGQEYIIKQPRKFIPVLGSTRYVGLVYEGDGLPRIHFDNDTSDYMLYNNNQFLFIKFKNLDFSCSSNNAKFLYSYGNGGAQDYSFDGCNWNGRWCNLFELRGINNNSEFSWVKCSVTARIADVMLDIDDSDQFLNYNFVNCKLWLQDGQCVRAAKGGHFKFTNCDWSGLQGSRERCTSTKGKYLFELTGVTHARGVCSFLISGGRFECKAVDLTQIVDPVGFTDFGINARLIYCEWNIGNVDVSFDSASTVITEFNSEYSIHMKPAGSTAGAILHVHDSMLIGKVKLEAAISGQAQRKVHSFENTTFQNSTVNLPSDAFDFGSTTQPISRPAITLHNCRPSNYVFNLATLTLNAWDMTLGNRISQFADAKPNITAFQGNASGGCPISNLVATVKIPPNSLITKVTFINGGTLSASTACNWSVREFGGVMFAETSAKPMNTPYNVSLPTAKKCASGVLELYDAALAGLVNSSTDFRCIVEYIS